MGVRAFCLARLIDEAYRRQDFMKIKTNFSPPKQQVEDLIEEGRRQIKNDPQIRKMLIDLGG